jgi:hypothetical protein
MYTHFPNRQDNILSDHCIPLLECLARYPGLE